MIRNTTLGELANISDGDHLPPPKSQDGVPFITISNIDNDNHINFSKVMFVPEKYYDGLSEEKKAHNGDILYSVVGSFGKPVYIDYDKKFVFQRHIAILKPNNTINSRYLYYVMLNPDFYYIADKMAIGAAQRTITLDSLRNISVNVHSLDMQNAIVDVLSCIDKKIQCNKKINDNLQHQLKLMYDYWFTQFDFPDENGKPYRASGGAMVWNEQLKREIPVGWECKSLGDILEKNSETFDYKGIKPTIDLSVMPSSSISLSKLNSSDLFSTNLFIMHEGDILFGSIRPYLKKAGIAPCNGVVAGTIHSYHTKYTDDYNFALFTLCRDSFFDYALSVSTGTKMPVINSDNILSYRVPYSKDTVTLFNEVKIKNIMCKNIQEIQRLSQLRDWLLPMLMNGQASIIDEHEEKPQIKVSGFDQWLANQGFAARGDVDMDVLRDIYEAMDSDDK